jgi:hypothetical protein
MRRLSPAIVSVLILGSVAAAEPLIVEEPAIDLWNYPFNQNPGGRSVAKIFGPLTSEGFDPLFDNRDGQMLLGFDLSSAEVKCGTRVAAARITVQIESDQTFGYDPTLDPWSSFLLPTDPGYTPDPDPGRPLEIFGVAYRDGWTAMSYPENGPFCGGCNCFLDCKSVRNTYPTDLLGASGVRDISNNIDEAFDPVPFATAQHDTLTQGQLVPTLTLMTFDINVDDPAIQEYLLTGLNDGILMLMIASIFPSDQQVGGTFPEIMTKENLLVEIGQAQAAQLELTLEAAAPGDVTGDGIVNTVDLLTMLSLWGVCATPSSCSADINCSGTVDVVDLLILLSGWTF